MVFIGFGPLSLAKSIIDDYFMTRQHATSAPRERKTVQLSSHARAVRIINTSFDDFVRSRIYIYIHLVTHFYLSLSLTRAYLLIPPCSALPPCFALPRSALVLIASFW